MPLNKCENAQHPDYPLTVYYAFKQAESETEDDEADEEQETVMEQ